MGRFGQMSFDQSILNMENLPVSAANTSLLSFLRILKCYQEGRFMLPAKLNFKFSR